MRRIPRAFLANPKTGLLTPTPAFDWFARGDGIPSRKWDGLPCLIEAAPGEDTPTVWRGIAADVEPTPPFGTFIRTSDYDDPEVRGWVPVSGQVPEDAPFVSAVLSMALWGRKPEYGTYELVGPGIKGNPERFDRVGLLKHECVLYISCPRTLDGILMFMAEHDGEGIVWRYGTEFCQVTRRDLGLPWPE